MAGAPHILVFDSGLGGLTVARALGIEIPGARLTYLADMAGFPYGDWQEAALASRVCDVVGGLCERADFDCLVVACNTASIVALGPLRARLAMPVVGTVPAIKPAAAQSRSRIVGVLATPGTVRRDYTRDLIRDFAGGCEVVLKGSSKLAPMAEQAMRGQPVDMGLLASEVAPVFVERGHGRTDMVVLGCTHFPLLIDALDAVAPWPVTWLDPAPAIARRVAGVVSSAPPAARRGGTDLSGAAILTVKGKENEPGGDLAGIFQRFGFTRLESFAAGAGCGG